MRNRRTLPAACLSLAFALFITGCQSSQYYSVRTDETSNRQGSSSTLAAISGNGSGFEGRVVAQYFNFDLAKPCADVGANGKPLPNQEIFILSAAAAPIAHLVREGCADLASPVILRDGDIQKSADGTGSISYLGIPFTPIKAPTDFDVIAASCPAGMTPIPGAVRSNLILDSQNLLSANWYPFPGIGVQLNGSLAGLPEYEVVRNDSANLDTWRSAAQKQALTPGRAYVGTFYAAPGSVGQAMFSLTDVNQVFMLQATFDLKTGASSIGYNTGALNASVTSQPYGAGTVNTMYFTPPVGTTLVSTGVMPFRASAPTNKYGNLGDSINATAVQMEQVDTFCR